MCFTESESVPPIKPDLNEGRRWPAVALVILVLLVVAVIAFGCSTRTYRYRSPDGSEIDMTIVGTDTQVGVLHAGRKLPDGTHIYLDVENLSAQDRSLRLIEELLKHLPSIPMPTPVP